MPSSGIQKKSKQRYQCAAYENQALSICPQYYNDNHPFPLHRFDLVIQFIVQYITSCGLHGSCWKQIISAINQITSHQNKAKSPSPDIQNMKKKKRRKHSYSSEEIDNFDPFSLCCFWHSFHSKYSHHSHESHQAKKLNAYLLDQFMSYLNNIHTQSSDNNAFPFNFYVIDQRIEQNKKQSNSKQEMDESDDEILNETQVKITSIGVEYPCMQNRKLLKYDDAYKRFNEFKTKQNENITNNKKNKNKYKKSLNFVCFICDVYIVSNISLRRRFLGYSALFPEIRLNEMNEADHTNDGLRYCVLEKVGRAGVSGLMQTDLLFELKTDSKRLYSAIKNLKDFGLIITESDMEYANCNRLWLSKYKFVDEVDRTLTDYKKRLIPSSHAMYCYDKAMGNNVQFIQQHIIPKIVLLIEQNMVKNPHGIMIVELKKFANSLDFSQDCSLKEMALKIPWECIEDELKKHEKLEIHRVYSEESEVQRTFRIKSDLSTNTNNDEEVDDDDNEEYYENIGVPINDQILKLIQSSKIEGILATQIFKKLRISSKDGHKRLNKLCEEKSIVSVSDTVQKSHQSKRYFGKEHYYKLMKKKKEKRQNVMPRFNKRLDLLQTYLNNNNGVVSVIEARRYLKTMDDDDYNGDNMMLDAKTFSRLTNNLIKHKKIKIIHYNVDVRMHAVILANDLDAQSVETIKLAKTAIHRSTTKNSKIFADSKYITKLSNEQIKSTKTERPKKRKLSEINIASNKNVQPLKKRKIDDFKLCDDDIAFDAYKPIKHIIFATFYGYIRPTMSRIRLLHEYLLQYKKNEHMDLIHDIEYDDDGMVVSTSDSVSRDRSPTPTPSLGHYSNSEPMSPRNSWQNKDRLIYSNGVVYNRRNGVLPPPIAQDDMINSNSVFGSLSPTLRDDNVLIIDKNVMRRRRKRKTMRESPFVNILKTFPFKLFLQIIGGDARIEGIEDESLFNVRICNLPKNMYDAIMNICDSRTMRLCRLMDYLKKLELLEFIQDPYHETLQELNDEDEDEDDGMEDMDIDNQMICQPCEPMVVDEDDSDNAEEEEDEKTKKREKKKHKKSESTKKKKKKKDKDKKKKSKKKKDKKSSKKKKKDKKSSKKKSKKKSKSKTKTKTKKKPKKAEEEEKFGPAELKIVDLSYMCMDSEEAKYIGYKILKPKPIEIIHVHSTEITMHNIEMATSSITGGREWHLTSNEKIDEFWKEFQKEVGIVLQKHPQLSTAKRVNICKDPNEEKTKKEEIITKKSKGDNKPVIIRRVHRYQYNDDCDEECDELTKVTAAKTVRTLFNSRPIIISEYPIDEFPRLYGAHEWDISRITPQKQWQIQHEFEDFLGKESVRNVRELKVLYHRMRVFAKRIYVSLQKMLSYLAYIKYSFLKHNYEYLRFSFISETPPKEYIDQQLAKKNPSINNAECPEEEKIDLNNQSAVNEMNNDENVNENGMEKVSMMFNLPKRKKKTFQFSLGDENDSQSVSPMNVDSREEKENEEEALPFAVSLKWTQQEDVMIIECFRKWKKTLSPNDMRDHTKFLMYAHKELKNRLHRNKAQITRRWRIIRTSLHVK